MIKMKNAMARRGRDRRVPWALCLTLVLALAAPWAGAEGTGDYALAIQEIVPLFAMPSMDAPIVGGLRVGTVVEVQAQLQEGGFAWIEIDSGGDSVYLLAMQMRQLTASEAALLRDALQSGSALPASFAVDEQGSEDHLTPTPEADLAPFVAPTPTPQPTEAAMEATPGPTAEVVSLLDPTAEPEASDAPEATPAPTLMPTPAPTAQPEPTAEAEPEPTVEPEPSATATAEPTAESRTAGKLPVYMLGVSSVRADGAGREDPEGTTYEAENVIDDDPATFWIPEAVTGTEGNGIGDWIDFYFDAPVMVRELSLRNGNGASKQDFFASSRPSALEVSFQYAGADGFADMVEVRVNDGFVGEQKLQIGGEHTDVEAVRIEIAGVFEGTMYPGDVCITELSIVGAAM